MKYIPIDERDASLDEEDIELESLFTVYAVEDVRTHTVRIVGYTDDIYQICSDLYSVTNLPEETERWVIDLYDQGYAPVLHILDAGIEDIERAMKIKRYWSRHYQYVSARDLPVVPLEDDIRSFAGRSRQRPRTEKLHSFNRG